VAFVPNARRALVIGFYEDRELTSYVNHLSVELGTPVRYLRETVRVIIRAAVPELSAGLRRLATVVPEASTSSAM
jgi:hypothetical protein